MAISAVLDFLQTDRHHNLLKFELINSLKMILIFHYELSKTIIMMIIIVVEYIYNIWRMKEKKNAIIC